jgi:hypothetical protein
MENIDSTTKYCFTKKENFSFKILIFSIALMDLLKQLFNRFNKFPLRLRKEYI